MVRMESGEAVTLLSYGPRTSRPSPLSNNNRKQEKFSFKFRRRSKSAPRNQNNPERDLQGKITYSANGETKVRNPDSPFKSDASVQLVGFTSGDSVTSDSAVVSAGSGASVHTSTLSDGAAATPQHTRTLNRTSKDIKMERERLRQERLGNRAAWRQLDSLDSAANNNKLSDLNSRLADERARFLEDAKLWYGGQGGSLNQFLQEREQRLMQQSGAAFPSSSSHLGSDSQLISDSRHSDMNSGAQSRERIIPITITRSPVSQTETKHEPSVRIIPVMVETSDNNSDSSSDTQSPDSVSPEEESQQESLATLPSLFQDIKMLHGNQPSASKRTSYHHPSFANHFGFSRLRGHDSGDKSILFSSAGIRDSFPGFPSFGNFPSFTPLLSDRPFPDHQARLRDKVKANNIHKQRSTKSKSSAEYPSSSLPRYVGDDGEEEGERGDQYGDSESESDDDDMDSVSVIVDRTRDRLSGTGSTHSHDGSTASSHDSGISEEVGSDGGVRGRGGARAKRPDSAVPSEYSLVSDTSSEGAHDDKIFSVRCSEARPLLVTTATTEDNAPVTDDYQERLNKAYVIASELVKTEVRYVSILHLIDQVFHFRVDQENRAQHMFSQDLLPTIFSNIKSIYKFHAEFLLPQLQERMSKWQEDPNYQRIGDIMVKNAPFLKMYTEYVKNFDKAMNTINTLYNKNSKFAAIVDEIHNMAECEHLTLQHHMLTPIQRIPRYEMLLKDYCQKLPDNSPDRADAESALVQVSQAAAHANDSMKRIEQFKKLLEVQESLGGSIDLVSPTREVLKEGKIVKISARTGDHQDRYLFLLSDLLLLCSPRKSMISGPQFSLRAKFDVDNLQVLEGDNLVTANTFYVRDDTKSVELYTITRQEKEEWLEQLFHAIKSLYTRKSSLRVGRDILRPLDSEIGKRQPHMQRVDNVQKCTECSVQFSILKHKHNCRFCGAVFCSKCSDLRYPVPWEDGKKARICRSCHSVMTNQSNSPDSPEPIPVRPKGLLEVPASTPSVHSGWLVLRPPGSKSVSNKRYFILLSDFVLYSFRSEVDNSALTATPLPGFTILTGAQLKGDSGSGCSEKDRDKVIKMFHPSSKRTYYFAGTNPSDVERWAEVLSLASRAEIPESSSTPSLMVPETDNQSTSSTEYENGLM